MLISRAAKFSQSTIDYLTPYSLLHDVFFNKVNLLEGISSNPDKGKNPFSLLQQKIENIFESAKAKIK